MKNTKLCPRCGHPICAHSRKKLAFSYSCPGCQKYMVDGSTGDICIRKCDCALSRKDVKNLLREKKKITDVLTNSECKFSLYVATPCGRKLPE